METLVENILTYSLTALLCFIIIYWYLRSEKKKSVKVLEKIDKARTEGLYEPVSLHPVVNVNSCIGTGACIAACPEKDILGIIKGKATTINASQCIGHGACFHACPTEAITLVIGTEKRGVDLPHIKPTFETNVAGIYIAGELGGMGLIKNAVEQGKQAVENLTKAYRPKMHAQYDLAIVGAGPAGISASLTAKKLGLNFITLEQESLGGTVFTYPRSKIIMTSAMNLPLHGTVKLSETSKQELLTLWLDVLGKNSISIHENTKVEKITGEAGKFVLETNSGENINTSTVLLALGRRGTPRKLGVKGEGLEKVAYRLLEPENITGKDVLVVGGGDSAVESAMLLADSNKVTVAYRSEGFSRLKPRNASSIKSFDESDRLSVLFNTEVAEITEDKVMLRNNKTGEALQLKNDLVYIFAGGELPTQFLINSGITVEKKFGEAILSHKRK